MPSGAAANFALALAALGVRVGLLTRVGEDELGQWLLRRLEQAGVDTTAAACVPGQLTPVSFASADLRGGKRFTFYRFPGYCDPMGALSPIALDRATLQRTRLFDFSEAVIRSEQLRATALQAARWCREAGGRVVYAVNYRPQSWPLPAPQIAALQREAIAHADVALMNEEEYHLIFGDEPAPFPGPGGPVLIVTAGERGGWTLAGATRAPFAAWPVPVQYDVGAGDSFHAGYVAAWLEGQPPAAAVRFAAACAALKITRPASAPPPRRAEVEAFMRAV
jgi:sugar/nucleoside kinase (ribokinase family)